LDSGAGVNLLSHISHKWPNDLFFETVEPSIVTAARLGNYEICKLLIHKNANINKSDSFQMTALHWASKLGHLEIVKLLIYNRARIDQLDYKNQTALEKCIIF
jgi:ankyrin repeat protein